MSEVVGADPTGVRPIEHWIPHVDLDQFIAAVEVLRRPELAGLPVVVGGDGDPSKRGVVSTASYEAREHGVGSGMPLRLAKRKCPEAVFLPVDRGGATTRRRPRSWRRSARSMGWLAGRGGGARLGRRRSWPPTWRGAAGDWAGAPGRWQAAPTPVVEAGQGSLPPVQQEAGGPAPGGRGPGGPVPPLEFAEQIRARVLEATALHCSVGIGDNKLRAKIATDFGKPRGSYVLTADNWFEVMGERPTTALWGIGAKTAKKLAALGIDTVTQLAESTRACWPRSWGRRWGRGITASGAAVGQRGAAEPWVPRSTARNLLPGGPRGLDRGRRGAVP